METKKLTGNKKTIFKSGKQRTLVEYIDDKNNKKWCRKDHLNNMSGKGAGWNLKKHGMYKSRMYRIWSGMRQRCMNKHNKAYKYYGGRGIKICKRWESFNNFFDDMKKTYKDNLSIDRIDNNKGYSKSNCRWATTKTQTLNRNCVSYKCPKCLKFLSRRKYKGLFLIDGEWICNECYLHL